MRTKRSFRRCARIGMISLALSVPSWSATGGGELFNKFKSPFTPKPAAVPDTSLKTRPAEAPKPAAAAKPSSNKPAADSKNANALSSDLAKARMHERNNEWDKARKIYESLISQNPNDASAYHRLGVVADQQRRYTEAQGLFTEALRMRPRDAEIFNDLGYCFFLQGKLDKAESALLKATQLDPKAARYRNNLGMVLGHSGKFQEAFNEFARAGSDADAFYNLAFVYTSKEQPEKAKDCFRRALAIDPKHDLSRKALQSFQLYDSADPDTRDLEIANNGVRLVPYVEGAGANSNTVPASARGDIAAPAASSLSPRMADGAAQSMQRQSRGMLDRNMSSKREGGADGAR